MIADYRPLISIVIPTHNRASYGRHVIPAILESCGNRCEVVVHDTSDVKPLGEYLGGLLHDPRLRYVHVDEPLSMTENHNRALSLVRGEFVCVIGDDDVVLPEVVDVAEWMKANAIDMVTSRSEMYYCWPDYVSKYFGRSEAGRLYLYMPSRDAVLRDCSEGARMSLARAAQGSAGLPRIYHGLVRREKYETLRVRSGNYVHGTSPDVSGSLGLALLGGVYAEIGHAFSIPGVSGGSNSGRHAARRHHGRLEDDPHTSRYRNLSWPDEIPRYFGVETSWAHAAVETLHAFGLPARKEFNFERLYGICFVSNPGYWREIRLAASKYCYEGDRFNMAACTRVLGNTVVQLAQRLARVTRRMALPTAAKGRPYLGEIENIARAVILYKKWCVERGIDFHPPVWRQGSGA